MTHPPSAPRLAQLRDFVSQVCGAGARFTDRSRTYGRRSVVWHVRRADGTAVFVKQHEVRMLYDRALRAYQEWLPRLAPDPAYTVPDLVAHDDGLGALIVTSVPGKMVEDVAATHPNLPGVYRAAGRFLAALQAVPIEPTQSPAELIAKNVTKYIGAGEGALPEETLAWAYRELSSASFRAQTQIVAAHMDYSARNWLVSGSVDTPCVGVIDWERARPFLRWAEAQRMAVDHWHGRDDLRDAFWDGYGTPPSADEQRIVWQWSLLSTVPSFAWAASHDDSDFVNLSRTLLDRLIARLT